MSGAGMRGNQGSSGGLRADEDPARQGALREAATEGGGGALRSAEVSPPIVRGSRTPAAPAVVAAFFSKDRLQEVNSALLRKEWVGTLQALGLGEQAASFHAETLAPEAVATALRAFVDRRAELERRGADFGYLKRVASEYKALHAWFGALQGLASKSDAEAAAGLRKLVRAELGDLARVMAERSHSDDQVIDYVEWASLVKELKKHGPSDAWVDKAALQACRTVTQDPRWKPPPPPDNEAARKERAVQEEKAAKAAKAQAEAEAKRERAALAAAEEQRRVAEAQVAKEQVEAAKRQAEAAKQQAEATQKQEAAREAEERRKAAEAEKDRKQAEARAAEAKRLEAEALRAVHDRRVEETKQVEEGNRAAFSGAVMGMLVGVPVALALGAWSGVFSGSSAIAVGSARSPLALERTPQAVAALCKAAETPVEGQWGPLQRSFETSVDKVPRAKERERLRERWKTECPGIDPNALQSKGASR